MECCLVCTRSLKHLNASQRNSHVNKCLDKHSKDETRNGGDSNEAEITKQVRCKSCRIDMTWFSTEERKAHRKICVSKKSKRRKRKRAIVSEKQRTIDELCGSSDAPAIRKDILRIDREIHSLQADRDRLVTRLCEIGESNEEDDDEEQQPGLLLSQPPPLSPPEDSTNKMLFDLTHTPNASSSNAYDSAILSSSSRKHRKLSSVADEDAHDLDVDDLLNLLTPPDRVMERSSGVDLSPKRSITKRTPNFVDMKTPQLTQEMKSVGLNAVSNDDKNVMIEKLTEVHRARRCIESILDDESVAENNRNDDGDVSDIDLDAVPLVFDNEVENRKPSTPTKKQCVLSQDLSTPNYAKMLKSALKKELEAVGCKTTLSKAHAVEALSAAWRAKHRGEDLLADGAQHNSLTKGNNDGASCTKRVTSRSNSRVKKSKVDKEKMVLDFIRTHPELYQQVLLFQPIELSHLHLAMKNAGLRCGQQRIRDTLDSHGVLTSDTHNNKKSVNHLNGL